MARLKAADREHICVLDANNHHDPYHDCSRASHLPSFRYEYCCGPRGAVFILVLVVWGFVAPAVAHNRRRCRTCTCGTCAWRTLYFDDMMRTLQLISLAMLLSDVSADKPPVGRHDAENEAIGLAFFKKNKKCYGLPASGTAAKVQRVACLNAAKEARAAKASPTSPSVSLPPSVAAPLTAAPALSSSASASPRAVEKSASSPPTPQVSPPPRAPRPSRSSRLRAQAIRGAEPRESSEAEAKEVARVAVEKAAASVAATAAEAKVAVEAAAAPKSFLCATFGLCFG